MRLDVPKLTQNDIGRNFRGRASIQPNSASNVVTYLDLTGAEVWFIADADKGVKHVEQQAIIDGDPTLGKVKYASKSGDLDTVGLFNQKWEARWSAPIRVISFPDGGNQFRVTKDSSTGP